jgi:hypothetical protein
MCFLNKTKNPKNKQNHLETLKISKKSYHLILILDPIRYRESGQKAQKWYSKQYPNGIPMPPP